MALIHMNLEGKEVLTLYSLQNGQMQLPGNAFAFLRRNGDGQGGGEKS